MSGCINKVILVGNVGKDPEIRSTNDGREIANITLATSDTWKDKLTGERKERTEWHRIVVLNEGLVSIIKRVVKKGSKLFIEGTLQTRKWTDNNGQERYTTEVVLQNFSGNLTMLDTRTAAGGDENYSNSSNKGSSQEFAHDELDDEIPF